MRVFILLLIPALCGLATADTVRLRNGEVLHGVIAGSNDTHIVFQEAPGISLTLPRSRIAGIEYGTPVPTRPSPAPSYRPPPEVVQWEQTAQSLDRQSASARTAQTLLRGAYPRAGALKQQVAAVMEQASAAAAEVKLLQPSNERNQFNAHPVGHREAVRVYNEKLREVEALYAEHIRLQGEQQRTDAAIHQAQAAIQEYLHAAAEVSTRMESLQSTWAALGKSHPDMLAYAEGVLARLQAHTAKIQHAEIPHQNKGRHFVVQARINDRAEGAFLVDTGATTVLVSAAFAARAGLPTGEPAKVSLADGSVITVRRTLLQSIRVGEVRAENVEAAVAPAPPGEGLDGLLGMSFLGRFDLSIDPASNRLIFRTLAE